MSVLVTGGAGYIGSVVVDQLIENGETVVVIDDLSTGNRDAVNDAATFYEASLLKCDIHNIIQRHAVAGIVHLAAKSLVRESLAQPFAFLRSNTLAALRLIEAAQSEGVERFVFASTANVYAPSSDPLTPDSPISPRSPYGESKYHSERALAWSQLRYTILRFFNVAGATGERGERRRDETHLIPRLLDVAAGLREGIEIYGDNYGTPDGTAIRDYVHVADVARAHVTALAEMRRGVAKAIYNLGSGSGVSVLEMIKRTRAITGHRIPFMVTDRQLGDPARLVADYGAAANGLQWEPTYTIDEIIKSAYEWRQQEAACLSLA